ncbi:hypothetical protein GF351_04425 [Candidatus Woesearchaeota archaeon]|nr:hypothetical protein [Candidatus Woesearchaeota archaeon]
MRYNSAAIVGPSVSGKTDAAIHIAKSGGAGLVCCDSLQMYKGVRIGSGLPPEEELIGLQTLLYGCLDQDHGWLQDEQYRQKAQDARRYLAQQGIPSVFEGCCQRFAYVLAEDTPAPEMGEIPVFVLTPKDLDIRRGIRQRVGEMLEQGLIDELYELIETKAHPRCYGIVHRGFLPYIMGKGSKNECLRKTVRRWEQFALSQVDSFMKMPGTRILTDSSASEKAVSELEKILL